MRLDALISLTGWWRVLLLFLSGVAAALALAPFYLWPLIVPAYGLLFHCLFKAENLKQGFRFGWWWGFGFFVAGLYWICISMTVDLARFGWMIPFALIGLNGGLALFTALAGGMFVKLRRPQAIVNWLLLAALLFALEWLRGHILTGFPWNLIGYVWGASDVSIQAASILSVYPLTFLTILLASSVVLWKQRRWPVFVSLAVVLLLLLHGKLTLFGIEPYRIKGYAAGAQVRLVQANIPQSLKWDSQYLVQSVYKHIKLSTQPGAPEIIIWSESAYPFAIDVNKPLDPPLYDWLKPNQVLITGGVTFDSGQVANSMVAINHLGEIVARYDKQHLVPFGEYVPFRGYLPIDKLAPGIGDFTPGTEKRSLSWGEQLFHPLICYEIIFPDYAAGEGAILNITNDDWFGYSSGPFQHLMMARFRAVEQGRPLIRVANSGVSAVIDQYGRIQQQLPLHEEGIIDISGNKDYFLY